MMRLNEPENEISPPKLDFHVIAVEYGPIFSDEKIRPKSYYF